MFFSLHYIACSCVPRIHWKVTSFLPQEGLLIPGPSFSSSAVAPAVDNWPVFYHIQIDRSDLEANDPPSQKAENDLRNCKTA